MYIEVADVSQHKMQATVQVGSKFMQVVRIFPTQIVQVAGRNK